MSDEWITRATLLQRAKDPDNQAAWEELVTYYKGFILIVVRHMNISENDCDDLVQEVLIKIWRNLSKFEIDSDRAKFRTWLSTIIRNTVLNYIDKNDKREDTLHCSREHSLYYRQ